MKQLNDGGLVTIGLIFLLIAFLFVVAFAYALVAAAREWLKKRM